MAISGAVAVGITSALIQGIQAWMAMARQSGLTDLQIIAMMDEQYVQFQKNRATPLPDPDA